LTSISPKEHFKTALLLAQESIQKELALAEQLLQNVVADAPWGGLKERLQVTLSRPGKRVRSTVMYLLAKCGSQEPDSDRMARVGAAIEALHLASLVHDDIIDASEIRRGENTAHTDWGNKVAVLIGDYLLSKSLELVIEDQERSIPLILSKVSSRLVEGEVMELDLSSKDSITLSEYLQVIDGKTASLLEACAECGAILAGFTLQQRQECRRIGRGFGLAFQIIDDLLDYGMGATDLGKSTYADVSNGLMTLPLLYFFQNATEAQKSEMNLLIRNSPPQQEQKKQIFDLLYTTDSFKKTHELAMSYLDDALAMIHNLPESANKKLLENIYQTMAFRGF
jgi:octaprenyl-diphosphate synthase